MIVVHHLNNSRSQRILWLLEELGVPYEIRFYQRDSQTNLAPPELKAAHPLGKSPVLEEDGLKIAESGAIVDYLIRRHGGGRFAPPAGSNDHEAYLEWLHYAEGSAMLPLMLNLYVQRLGDAAEPLRPRIDSELANHLGFVNTSLEGREYLVGGAFSGADVQMSFVGELAKVFGRSGSYPAMGGWLDRLHARPAFARALEKGGAYAFA